VVKELFDKLKFFLTWRYAPVESLQHKTALFLPNFVISTYIMAICHSCDLNILINVLENANVKNSYLNHPCQSMFHAKDECDCGAGVGSWMQGCQLLSSGNEGFDA
jgi:hypothetical protein